MKNNSQDHVQQPLLHEATTPAENEKVSASSCCSCKPPDKEEKRKRRKFRRGNFFRLLAFCCLEFTFCEFMCGIGSSFKVWCRRQVRYLHRWWYSWKRWFAESSKANLSWKIRFYSHEEIKHTGYAFVVFEKVADVNRLLKLKDEDMRQIQADLEGKLNQGKKKSTILCGRDMMQCCAGKRNTDDHDEEEEIVVEQQQQQPHRQQNNVPWDPYHISNTAPYYRPSEFNTAGSSGDFNPFAPEYAVPMILPGLREEQERRRNEQVAAEDGKCGNICKNCGVCLVSCGNNFLNCGTSCASSCSYCVNCSSSCNNVSAHEQFQETELGIDKAPQAGDITWDNMKFTETYSDCVTIIGALVLFIFMVLFVTPLVFATRLKLLLYVVEDEANEQDKQEKPSSTTSISSSYIEIDEDYFSVFTTSYLPTLLMLIVNSFVLPCLVWLCTQAACYWKKEKRERASLFMNFFFIMVNIVLLPLFGLDSVHALVMYLCSFFFNPTGVLGDPNHAPVPWRTGGGRDSYSWIIFPLKYLISTATISSVSQLMQLPRLVHTEYYEYFFVVTEAEKKRARLPWPFDFGYWYAFNDAIFCMGLVFGSFSPFVLLCSFVVFGIKYFVDKYVMLYGVLQGARENRLDLLEDHTLFDKTMNDQDQLAFQWRQVGRHSDITYQSEGIIERNAIRILHFNLLLWNVVVLCYFMYGQTPAEFHETSVGIFSAFAVASCVLLVYFSDVYIFNNPKEKKEKQETIMDIFQRHRPKNTTYQMEDRAYLGETFKHSLARVYLHPTLDMIQYSDLDQNVKWKVRDFYKKWAWQRHDIANIIQSRNQNEEAYNIIDDNYQASRKTAQYSERMEKEQHYYKQELKEVSSVISDGTQGTAFPGASSRASVRASSSAADLLSSGAEAP